jgi:hypothetical protein
MEVIGADGVNVGIVDRIERNRIKLTRRTATRVSSPRSKTTRCGCLPSAPWR